MAKRGRFNVTIQLTPERPHNCVESAHLHMSTARFRLVLKSLRGNLKATGLVLNSYGLKLGGLS